MEMRILRELCMDTQLFFLCLHIYLSSNAVLHEHPAVPSDLFLHVFPQILHVSVEIAWVGLWQRC